MAEVKTVEDKVKEERSVAAKEAAVVGAEAVRDAVLKVANDAVEAAKSSAGPIIPEVLVTGTPGGKFEIRGNGFSSGGSVLIGGVAQQTYEWGSQYIRGKLDANVKSGEVVIQIDKETRKVGFLKV